MVYNNALDVMLECGIESVAKDYESYSQERDNYLDMARECAELTIPSLFPPDGANYSTRLFQPWQTLGARATNHLAGKLQFTTFPPNTPAFKITADDRKITQITGDPKAKEEVNAGFASIELLVQQRYESSKIRSKVHEALMQLIVGGNSCLYFGGFDKIKVTNLANYVVRRDYSGNVTKAIVVEKLSPELLDEEVLDACAVDEYKEDEDQFIYTCIVLEDKKYYVWQEINEIEVPGSFSVFKPADMPFMFLRWRSIDGESYGRGLVEQYVGSFRSLEYLTKALVEGSVAASKVLYLVEGGNTALKDLQNSANGSFIHGRGAEVKALQLEKFADFNIARQQIEEIKNELAYAFMMNSAIQRDAERVTTVEIRYMAQELEDQLGGIYSLLAETLQRPFVTLAIKALAKEKDIEDVTKADFANITVTTGIEALGRGIDADKLQVFANDVSILAQYDPTILEYVNTDVMLTRFAVARGIDTTGLIKPQQEVEAMRARKQQMEMAQQAMAAQQQQAPGQSADGEQPPLQ